MGSRLRLLYDVELTPEAPARARAIVARELAAALPPVALEDLKLLVSELVTKGILHTGPSSDDKLLVDVTVNGVIRCTVSDQGGRLFSPSRLASGSRWTIELVERLSRRWGFTRSRERTCVWFETDPL
jgi:hypothetical protein